MDRKNLTIMGLSLSALMMFCTLVIVDKTQGETTASPADIRSNLVAASIRYQANTECLILVDRSSHILRAYRIPAGQGQAVQQAGVVDLLKLFEQVRTPAVPNKKAKA